MFSPYESLLRPLLFCVDPETVHEYALHALSVVSSISLAPRSAPEPSLRREVFGLTFPNPLGLAAGFDKNGIAIPALAALGFGSVEIGTVTAVAQPGNPKPRMFRVPESEAIINRLGFNNRGAAAMAERLEILRRSTQWPAIPVGINIGKSRIVPLENAVEDYLTSLRLLREHGDYFVLNVSSPNTPGLRSLQDPAALGPLCATLRQELAQKPLLLKIAPDLTWKEVDDILATAESNGISGLIATNTTVDHSNIPASLRTQGGLSGTPLRDRSYEILKYIKTRSRFPVISVGGIMNVTDALARFDAGADLIQLYTGFIYRGPGLIARICRTLLERQQGSNALS
ncbi:MAG: quinone-dependent dihydroorotate dehydrogenase [Verrucomicrobia bacterium]|nr:quinone-dependent dihydroorotate dehydrogenase [Verrucomicrobiota bacterium]MBV8485722.1 quinone-dependent dihydroorotate dehydrogenase [Verrucomicrobiota bacterium]